jgi:Mn-dependent DtxR family transcriptional regulator
MKVHSKKILDFVKKNKIITSSELADYLKVSWNTADKWLLELVIEGKIERIKKIGVTLWVIKK